MPVRDNQFPPKDAKPVDKPLYLITTSNLIHIDVIRSNFGL